MAEPTNTTQDSAKTNHAEVALDMMKFIAVQTGYGKSTGQQTGFGAKGSISPEQYAEALLELYERCKKVVKAD